MCTCDICETARQQGEYVSPNYHHGQAEGFYRSEVCDCGFWSCGGRGCGDCPDCLGERCECRLPDLRHEGIERVLRSLRSDLIHHSKAVEGSPLSRAQVEAAIHALNSDTTAWGSDEFRPAETCWNCQQPLPIEVRTPALGTCPHCDAVVVPF